jgi:methyl-accepting chemotaxis protein WspA
MFKTSSLGGRVFASYIVMGIFIFIIATIGNLSTNRLKGHIDVLTNNTLPSVVGLWQVNEGQTQIESSERLILSPNTTPKERESEFARIDRAWQQIEQGLASYEPVSRTTQQEKDYQIFNTDWQTWKGDHQTFIGLAKQIDPTDEKPSSNLLAQMDRQIEKNKINFTKSTNDIVKLIDDIQNHSNDIKVQSDRDTRNASFLTWLANLLGPLMAIGFGWYFSQSLAKPLGTRIAKVVQVAEDISIGNLASDIEDNGIIAKDEIGKLQMSFRNMKLNLNSLLRQVQQSSIQIVSSANQIAASGKELEATMTQQVASITQVSATGKEIASTADELARTIDRVASVSGDTAMAAAHGQQDLLQMESTMRQLTEATGSISGKLGAISEKANNISSVVTTITKVADQTNLLSLNAAIEAEKAGEYGAGFAVVAREIRRLADQTAVATLEIESMVKDMQSAVSSGVMEMDKFTQEVSRGVDDVRKIGGQLAEVIDRVQSLTPQFNVVNEGMSGQSQGAQQISDAMYHLSESSQQMALALRDNNNAIDQLNTAAEGLQREISRFKVQS